MAELMLLASPMRSKAEYNSAVYVLLHALDCFLETYSVICIWFEPIQGPSRFPSAIMPLLMAKASSSVPLKLEVWYDVHSPRLVDFSASHFQRLSFQE